MKNKLIKLAFIALFGIAVSYSIYSSRSETKISDLALDNVEALASSEWGGFNCFWLGNYDACVPWGSGTGCPCWM